MKSLVDLCLFSVSNNLNKLNNVGSFLSWSDKEVLLERLCDHDMLTEDNITFISKHIFSPQLQTVSLKYNDKQITDNVLGHLAISGCQLSSLTLKYCHKLTGKPQKYLICKSCLILVYVHASAIHVFAAAPSGLYVHLKTIQMERFINNQGGGVFKVKSITISFKSSSIAIIIPQSHPPPLKTSPRHKHHSQ